MPSSALCIHVVGAKPGTQVEVVPGKTYMSLPLESVDSIGLTEMVPAGAGTFRPVVRICPRWFTLNERNLKRLGIPISRDSMIRLLAGGFVGGMALTPGVRQFDFFSYRQHEAAAADVEFWDRTEPGHRFTNRQRYLQAL